MANLTRMHFRALAEALHGLQDLEDYEFRQVCEAVASVCRSFNPRFDSSKFYEACGYYDRG